MGSRAVAGVDLNLRAICFAVALGVEAFARVRVNKGLCGRVILPLLSNSLVACPQGNDGAICSALVFYVNTVAVRICESTVAVHSPFLRVAAVTGIQLNLVAVYFPVAGIVETLAAARAHQRP